jgi:hypothetical protein
MLQTWDLCHLKDTAVSYSQKFESLNLLILTIFYEFFKLVVKANSENLLKKRKRAGLLRSGRI